MNEIECINMGRGQLGWRIIKLCVKWSNVWMMILLDPQGHAEAELEAKLIFMSKFS
jgi:hypothetical protein